MEDAANQFEMFLLVALAMGLGALVGIEREISDKPAGLRTHMLVAGGCCLIALLGQSAFANNANHTGDPARTLHGIVTGIGFLGAGAIIKGQNGRTEGLTTAASVLFVAVTGAAVAYSYWLLALGATLLAIMTLSGVRALEGYFMRRRGIRVVPQRRSTDHPPSEDEPI